MKRNNTKQPASPTAKELKMAELNDIIRMLGEEKVELEHEYEMALAAQRAGSRTMKFYLMGVLLGVVLGVSLYRHHMRGY